MTSRPSDDDSPTEYVSFQAADNDAGNGLVENVPPAPLASGDHPPAIEVGGDPIELGKDVQLNKQRHNLASHLLWGLLVIAAGLVVAVILVPSDRQADLREMATLIFPTLVTLAGTSFAWFYATRNTDR